MKVTVILLFVCALKVIEVQCQGDMFSNMMMMRLLGGQMGGQSGSIGQSGASGSMYGSAMPTTAGGNGLMGGGGGMNMLAAGAMGGVMGGTVCCIFIVC